MSPRTARLVGMQAVLALACLGLGGLAGWMLRAPAPLPPSYSAVLKADLGLRPEQVAALDAIQTDFDRELDELLSRQRQAIQEEVAERLDRCELAILAVLDEGQRERYEQLKATEGR